METKILREKLHFFEKTKLLRNKTNQKHQCQGTSERVYVTPGCGRGGDLDRTLVVMSRRRRVRLLAIVGQFLAQKSPKIPDLREWGLEHTPERALGTLLRRNLLRVCQD